MSKINITMMKPKRCITKRSDEIEVGTVFTGEIGNYSDTLFIKTYDRVVSLNDPFRVWSCHEAKWKDFQEVDLNIEVIFPPCC